MVIITSTTSHNWSNNNNSSTKVIHQSNDVKGNGTHSQFLSFYWRVDTMTFLLKGLPVYDYCDINIVLITRTEQTRAGIVKTNVVKFRIPRLIRIMMVGIRKSRGTNFPERLGGSTVYVGYGIMVGWYAWACNTVKGVLMTEWTYHYGWMRRSARLRWLWRSYGGVSGFVVFFIIQYSITRSIGGHDHICSLVPSWVLPLSSTDK